MLDKICYRCKKKFTTTQDYVRHLQRKYPCKVLETNQNNDKCIDIKKVLKCNENVTSEQETKVEVKVQEKKNKKIKLYKCDACKATFKHRQNKYAHLKTCKKLKEKNKNEKIKELNRTVKELKLQKRIVVVNKQDYKIINFIR